MGSIFVTQPGTHSHGKYCTLLMAKCLMSLVVRTLVHHTQIICFCPHRPNNREESKPGRVLMILMVGSHVSMRESLDSNFLMRTPFVTQTSSLALAKRPNRAVQRCLNAT